MAQNYTRQSSFADGDTITAALFNNEFNQVVNAFAYSASSDSSTGHKHDGTAGQGGNIPKIGDIDFLNKIVVASNTWEFYVEVSSATAKQMVLQDGALVPNADSDLDLGTSSIYWKNAFIDSILTTGNVTVGGIVSLADGSASAPSLTNTGDTNAGLFFSAADVLSFTSGGTAQFTMANGAIAPVTDSDIDLGTSSLYFKDSFIDTVTTTGNVTVGGTLGVTGVATVGGLTIGSAVITEAELETIDTITAGTVAASKAVVVDANKDITGFRNITLTGELDAATLDVSGAVDIAGTTNLDVVDIDGNVQIDGTVTVGVDDTGKDVKFFGATSGKYMQWDESADSLLIEGTLDVAGAVEFNSLSGTGAVTITNILDEDDMSSDSATVLATQQSIKAYVDAQQDTVDTFGEILALSNTSSGTNVELTTTDKVQFRDSAIFINSSADGQLDIVADTEIQIAATTIDINGAINASGEIIAASLDISGNVDIDGTLETDALSIASTAVTSTAAELNILDGVTSTAAELNILDGVTSTAAELNILDGVTSTAAELNILDGVTSTAAELNILDGVTSTAAELNALDGITAVVGELNALDIGSTAVGTAVASKAVILDSNKDYTGIRNLTITGELDAATLDISGAIDVAGTTNLDVVDIDGAVDMATTLAVAGNVDFNGDLDVDGTTNLDVIDVDGAANFAADVTFADGADIITASAGTSNTRVGVNTGNSIASGGNYNVLVGDEAGTALTTGDGNVAVGFEALKTEDANGESTAVGYQALKTQNAGASGLNTAVGYQAGLSVTTGVQNTLIGAEAGDALTTGGQNVAIGYLALSLETTSSNNVAIGREALKTSNGGSGNTAVGRTALAATTTGDDNVGVGLNALLANTTGTLNVAVGMNAVDANTTGDKNTGIGQGALSTNTTADNNTAVGFGALNLNTTGDTNTAVGKDSMKTNTTGTNNGAFGTRTLQLNTTGSNNVAVGDLALGANTTASGNTGVGQNAGLSITTGVQNTIVGQLAGDALTTGDHNTCMGYQALSGATGADGNVAIGYQAGGSITGTTNAFVGWKAAGNAAGAANSNACIGAFAMSRLTTGDSNVSAGYGTLFAITTAAATTALGAESGANITTGSNNSFLGHDSGTSGSPGGNFVTASNAVCIGDENISEANIQVDWTVASDARDKTDFTALDLGLDFVKALAPVTYKWDKRSKYGDKKAVGYDLNAQTPDGTHKEDWLDIGFKAQEVEALEIAAGYNKSNKTNLVSSHTGDGKQMGLQYSKFVPILVKAMQEQNALIEALTARITTLEG